MFVAGPTERGAIREPKSMTAPAGSQTRPLQRRDSLEERVTEGPVRCGGAPRRDARMRKACLDEQRIEPAADHCVAARLGLERDLPGERAVGMEIGRAVIPSITVNDPPGRITRRTSRSAFT